ncbi:MAG: AAA family ATPase [Planctomycetaceae bacterium]|nr:AAA family ATPase [Planctomycetaceae bacterium]
MNQSTERNLVLYYLNNLMKRPLYGEIENRVCSWFEEHSRWLIGKDIEDDWEGRRYRWREKNEEETPPLPREFKTIRIFLNGKSGRLPTIPEVTAVIDAFQFSPEYYDVIALDILTETIPVLNDLVECCHDLTEKRRIKACMLDLSSRQYEKFLASTSELMKKGIYTDSHRGNGRDFTNTFYEILLARCTTPDGVKRIVLGKPQKATLKAEHFEHIKGEYVWLRNLLTNALAKQQRGVNLLIYGKPGTGKTELAKTLCREAGASLYGVSSNLSDERNSNERRCDLAAALCLLDDEKNSALLMDEAEDVFGASTSQVLARLLGMSENPRNSKSKLFFNKLLENNAVPVIWISNSIRGVDPAHLRRFSYALNMEAPDENVQARIWDYSARKNKVKLPKEKISKLIRGPFKT